MYGYIYLTTNTINNKKYIGQHRSDTFNPQYRGSGVLLKKAIDRYGQENFQVELLAECFSEDDLNLKEIEYIAKYNANNSDEYYNIAQGGQGHTCSAWNKGMKNPYKNPPSEKQLLALANGRRLAASDKQKAILASIRKSTVVTDSTRAKLRAARLDKKASDETKAKMAKSHLGMKMPERSQESRDRYRAASTGRVHIHKGYTNKNVLKSELATYYADGWSPGYYKK